MVKLWNGKNWVFGTLNSEMRQVKIGYRVHRLDEDGFLCLGSVKYRLFDVKFDGEPVGWMVKA